MFKVVSKAMLLVSLLSRCLVILALSCSMRSSVSAQNNEVGLTTAWHAGHFEVDTAGLLSRSNVVLTKLNEQPSEAMPLGNGRLGVAVWSARGFTAQLNRSDTWPHRDSPGQVVIPGLHAMTSAPDFNGYLDLFNGTLVERGGGITLRVYVQTSTDTLIVDVTGIDPNVSQTAELYLWPSRNPNALVSGLTGRLVESWTDNYGPGSTGKRFGSLAAIAAIGRDVSAAKTGDRSVTLSFKAGKDGHYQVVVASPHYEGNRNEIESIGSALSNLDPEQHLQWWHRFWRGAGLIKITSSDASGEYMENLRNLYLYTTAAESGDIYPGSQAGIADLFSAVQDLHHWDPAAFWHWNLRMQVAANLDAGLYDQNEPYFRLYRNNLSNIEAWTKQHMAGRQGICVPETMRFNGTGYEYEADWSTSEPPVAALNCDSSSQPYYNARTLSTGAEISLWIWHQYLATDDLQFLKENYPVMAASARFLMAYESTGPDHKMHTQPSNAHEQQWDTTDPTTDLAARMALFPVVIEAAELLHSDVELVHRLQAEVKRIPALPRIERAEMGASKQSVIAESYDPSAREHNEENIGLEVVWPYNLLGDDSADLDLARHTYDLRPYPVHQDWSFDPVQAARIGQSSQVRSTLIALTEKYQTYINGFANWGGPPGEFYVEQEGGVALALPEALVQDYDGLIRIAPAVPVQWDFEGTVWIRDRTRVNVQVHAGVPITVALDAGKTTVLRMRGPWQDSPIEVIDGNEKTVEVSKCARCRVLTFEFPVQAGKSYRIRQLGTTSDLPFAPLSGKEAKQVRTLGKVQIGK